MEAQLTNKDNNKVLLRSPPSGAFHLEALVGVRHSCRPTESQKLPKGRTPTAVSPHGHTAAELIRERAASAQPNMRFSVQVSEKVAAQAVPAIGAAGGALINTVYNIRRRQKTSSIG